jgi:hypothetical protein
MTVQNDRLEHDHGELDRLLESVHLSLAADDLAASLYELDLFWARLGIHIRAEHLHLFPMLLDKALAADAKAADTSIYKLPELIPRLRRDHDLFVIEIGKCVNRLRGLAGEEIADGSVFREIETGLVAVAARLKVHNEIEERDIYPLAYEMLTAEENDHLGRMIEKELINLPARFRGKNAAATHE